MLFSIADRIRSGVGVDYDYKMINVANRIRSYKGTANLDYYVFDLEKENLELLRNFIQSQKVDIVFLLSVCMEESAQIALSAVRSRADELGIDQETFERKFHVHVPAGAI